MLSKTKMTVFLAVALVAFELFGFGFLQDVAKLAIGVMVMAVLNKRKFAGKDGVLLEPYTCTFRTK